MKIVISGSMLFFKDMQFYEGILKEKNIDVVIPMQDDWRNITTKSEKIKYKKLISIQYFDELSSQDTDGILVLNQKKEGIENYIGANTFAEIVIAFYFKKHIYLLNDYYEPYNDELEGWEQFR